MHSYTMFATYRLKALTDALYIRYDNVTFSSRVFGRRGMFLFLYFFAFPVVDGISYLWSTWDIYTA